MTSLKELLEERLERLNKNNMVLPKINDTLSGKKADRLIWDDVDYIDIETRAIGLDYGTKDESIAVLTKLASDGSIIIIDEWSNITPEQYEKIMSTLGVHNKAPEEAQPEFLPWPEPIPKDGKLVKRHHPVPTTPKRWRP